MKRNAADMTSTNSVDVEPKSASCGSKTENSGMAGVDRKKQKACKPRKPKEKIHGGPNPPPGIPTAFQHAIQNMGGTDWRLIIQKGLHDTDLSRAHNRLSMPSKQWVTAEFLTVFENGDNVCFPMIDANMKVWESVTLRRWNMKKTMFVLAGDWSKLAAANHLRVKDVVQIWCFRFAQTGKHGLAMVKIETVNSSWVAAAASSQSHLSNNSPSSSSQDEPDQTHTSTTCFDIWKAESSTSAMYNNNMSHIDQRQGRLTEVASTESSNLSELADNSSSAYGIDFWKTESSRGLTQVPSAQSAPADTTSSDIDLSLHL
uniref:B3 domain-containing protein n=1 Tax=Kalanchoe fedtschenkoi TaxID=63787 RepID=A0A7N0UVT3_KALFE